MSPLKNILAMIQIVGLLYRALQAVFGDFRNQWKRSELDKASKRANGPNTQSLRQLLSFSTRQIQTSGMR
jgi:hypothetical protein